MSDFECVRGNAWVNLIDVFSSHIPQDTFPTITFELLVYCWYTWLYSCTQNLYVSICFNVREFTKKDNFDFQSLILIVCTPWNLECEFQSCFKSPYVLNLEMTNAHLTVWTPMTLNIKSPRTSWPLSSLIWHWRSHHPQRYSCGAAYGTRYQGLRGGNEDGMELMGWWFLDVWGCHSRRLMQSYVNYW